MEEGPKGQRDPRSIGGSGLKLDQDLLVGCSLARHAAGVRAGKICQGFHLQFSARNLKPKFDHHTMSTCGGC